MRSKKSNRLSTRSPARLVEAEKHAVIAAATYGLVKRHINILKQVLRFAFTPLYRFLQTIFNRARYGAAFECDRNDSNVKTASGCAALKCNQIISVTQICIVNGRALCDDNETTHTLLYHACACIPFSKVSACLPTSDFPLSSQWRKPNHSEFNFDVHAI